jgi:membrane protease YdiL (CAAX protease family)
MVVGVGVMTLSLVLGRGFGIRVNLLLAEVCLATPALLALVVFGIPLGAGIRLRGVPRATLLLSVGLGATLWLASLGLLELQYTVWAPPPGYLEAFRMLHEALRPANPADALLSLMAIALVPALCEEVLVRGVVLPSLFRAFGGPTSVVLSAFLFGLMHLDPYRFPFTCAVGLALGAVRLRTGSLLPSIAAHAALNGLTFVVAPLIDEPAQTMPDPRPFVGVALLALGVAASALAFRQLRR